VTRKPTGHPESDDAWGPSGPPRPRPARAGTGPLPGAATGRLPRATTDDSDRWSGTAPGYEFEGRRPWPGRGPRRPPPARPQAPKALPPGDQPPRDAPNGEPRRFRYTPTVSQPRPVPQPWPGPEQPARTAYDFGEQTPPRPRPHPSGPRPRPPVPGAARAGAPPAVAEWARLLRSFLPEPVKRRWSREFLDGLEFRGWGLRVAIPVLAMVVFGVAVVVIAGANSGHPGPAPPVTALGFPPATLAGRDFTAAASGRGISQTLGRVTSVGDTVVAVGSQAGGRIARAQFFVSVDDGRTWTMGTVRSADGGVPPPGHGAIFVAGSQGAWVALGSGSIWTSEDGRTWTLAPGAGMPLQPGDQISAVKRTADGFIAVGANVPAGEAARSTPLIFRSANGTTWQRRQPNLPAGPGHALDLRYAAAAGKLIMVAGDEDAITVTGKPKRPATVQAGAAWLSADGGSTWTPAAGPVLKPPGPGAQPEVTGLATAGGGFVLLRPATVAKRPAIDAYFSPNGLAFTFQATLSAAAGFTARMSNGGPPGAVVTGQEGGSGQALTAFVTPNGRTWQQRAALGTRASEAVSGVALAPDGAVITTGISAGQDGRQPVITLTGTSGAADQVDIAKIPGAVQPQLAVNGLAASGSTQVAVGSANGFPAAWTSADGGTSWTRATGATPAVFGRPGTQQLTSVTHGNLGWLAVGGVVAGSAQHPVVAVSADGSSWQATDGQAVFGAPGLFTEQAAADGQGYVIVGDQVAAGHTVAAAWWSATLNGWQRAGDATLGALDGPGDRRMAAVAVSSAGFVAVGSHGDQPSAWTSANGRTWQQADLPLPVGATRAALEHVASTGLTVAAAGTAVTRDGRLVPFAASSSDGGASWAESALPLPASLVSVTALASAGRVFTATGTYGSTPGHQDVVVWTSPNGLAWQAAEPAGQGLTGPGIQAITGLAVAGSTLAGVGFTATPAGEQPVFWQSPIR